MWRLSLCDNLVHKEIAFRFNRWATLKQNAIVLLINLHHIALGANKRIFSLPFNEPLDTSPYPSIITSVILLFRIFHILHNNPPIYTTCEIHYHYHFHILGDLLGIAFDLSKFSVKWIIPLNTHWYQVLSGILKEF